MGLLPNPNVHLMCQLSLCPQQNTKKIPFREYHCGFLVLGCGSVLKTRSLWNLCILSVLVPGGPAAPGLPALHRGKRTQGGGFAVEGRAPRLLSVRAAGLLGCSKGKQNGQMMNLASGFTVLLSALQTLQGAVAQAQRASLLPANRDLC